MTDCIVTQFGNTAELRFFNVIKEQFNVYVEVNETNVINEPSTTDLGSSFTVNLDAGDNLIRIRLAAKGSQPLAEVYDSDSFYYKVTTTDVLVSNLGQPSKSIVGFRGRQVATQFTTGSNPNGYTVSKVRLPISVDDAAAVPVVEIYSDVSGSPGVSIKTLTNPASITVSSTSPTEATFDADDYKLTANTDYWIVVENADESNPTRISLTTEDSEDAGGAPGWSIGNVSKNRPIGGTFSDVSISRVMQIGIKGDLGGTTLSDLVLKDVDDNNIDISPTFASGTRSYTAMVANSISRIKVEPTKSESNSTIQYLDSADMALTDADTNTGVFDVDLAEGENVIKIRVTAADGNASLTYTVTVTRADFLVSNFGQTRFNVSRVIDDDDGTAVQFTTGDQNLGYTISEIQLNLSADAGTTPVVSIYSDSFGAPGSSLTVLDNPDAIPTTETALDFDAGHYTLARNTPYWVVIKRASGSGEISTAYTMATAEDAGSAADWSIGDQGSLTSTGTWAAPPVGFTLVPQIRVKGTAVKGSVTLASNVDSLIRNLHDLKFTITRTGPTSEAAEVTLVVKDEPGGEVVSTREQRETLTFGVGVTSVEFTAPTFWFRGGFAGNVLASVQAPGFNTNGARTTIEAISPTGTLVEVSLENASYEVTEGAQLTFNMVYTVLEEIAAPTKDASLVSLVTEEVTAELNTDYIPLSLHPTIPSTAWLLVDDRYVAIVPVTLVTVDDALYERPMGVHEQLDLQLHGAAGVPAWVTLVGPTEGTTRYPVTIIDNETLNIEATLSAPRITGGSSIEVNEDSRLHVALEVSSTDTASTGGPVALPDDVKLKITPVRPPIGAATVDDDWTIDTDEIGLDGVATITIVDDTDMEGAERILFEVGLENDPTFQAARATLIIVDDDFAGPVLLSAEIIYDTLTLNFSTAIDDLSIPDGSSFTVKVGDMPVNLDTGSPVLISVETVTLLLDRGVRPTNVVTVSYTAPATRPLRDTALNNAPSFTDVPVTNKSSGPPRGPASLTATPGNAEVELTWTPPTHDGNSAITNYRYRVSDDGGNTWNPDWTDVPDSDDAGTDQGDETSYTVDGLTNDIEHTFQVRATNGAGSSGGIEAKATPTAPPMLPLTVNTVAGDDIVNATEKANGFTVSGATGTVAGASVVVVIGNSPNLTATSDSQGDWSVAVPGNAAYVTESTDAVTVSAIATGYTIPTEVIRPITVDLTAPTLSAAAVNGESLVLTYREALDAASTPPGTAFTVKVGGVTVSLGTGNPVSISGGTVTLVLDSAVTAADTVTVSYAAPGADPIRDPAANNAPSFTDEPVTNRSANIGNTPATGKPTISGVSQEGQTLTASTSSIQDADGFSNRTFTYQWVRVDGGTDTDIIGATSQTYVLTSDDVGYTVKVRVKFADDLNNPEEIPSDAYPASGSIQAKPNTPAIGRPAISGTPQRDQTLTASTSGIRDADGLSNPGYSYQWVRVDGATETSISGATSQSYLLTADEIGHQIKVIVQFTDDRNGPESAKSVAFPSTGTIQNKPNRQPTGRPTLSGQHQVGHTLTADTSGIDDRDGLTNPGYTYQWQRRDGGVYTDISGADSMVYTLSTDDQGKRVRVQVTFNDDDENVHTLDSSPSGVVQAQTSLPSSKVKVSLDATAYVVEEGQTVQITVTLAEAPEEDPVYILFTVTPGNGARRSEFDAWSSASTDSLRFAAGQTTDWIKIRPDDDTLNDDGETIRLCLDNLPEPYATLAGLNCATINIVDNDDPNSVRVTFRSDTYWASEDGNPAWPRISVHPVPDRQITIPITFTRGGGLSEDDYEIVTTSVTFGPGLYGMHGDGHFTDGRTYASFPIEIWAIDDDEDDDGEYMDLAFGDLPPFVSAGGTGKFSYRPTTARVWFNDNEFTQVAVTDPPNPLGFSKRMRVSFADAELEAKEGQYSNGCVATVRVRLSAAATWKAR